jgi:transcriptional regulator with XRE-family HTH domain
MSPPRAPRNSSTAFIRALGASVRARRMRLGQTRVELARRTGLSESAIISIEDGDVDLDLLKLVKLAEALKIPLRILLRRAERQVGARRKKKRRSDGADATVGKKGKGGAKKPEAGARPGKKP